MTGKNITKITWPNDMSRLKGDAAPTTHLRRYTLANNAGEKAVLDVHCDECGAAERMQCIVSS